jgi:hypothetical protein
MQDEQQPDLVGLSAEIVSAYVAKNHIQAITRLPPRLSLPAGPRGSAPAWGRSRMSSGCGCATRARRQGYSRRFRRTSQSRCCATRSPRAGSPNCRRAPSSSIGAPTRCAPIGLPGRSPAAAARRRAGTGARARASGRRRRRTATRALPGGRGIAAFAASRCSALAGTAILPAPAARAAGSGTRPASRRGSSGTRGRRLLRGAEVDHRVPLFQVRRERQDLAWPDLLTFWGAPNLQVVNRAAHVAKCSAETAERARLQAAAQLPAAPTA